MLYTIRWGHSGDRERHWTTAREASMYASEVWGAVEAETAEAAARIAADETGEALADWYADGDVVHLILGDGPLPGDLRAARDRLGLSQRAMAEALGVPLRTYESWEGGQEPQHPSLVRLAVAEIERRHG